MNPHRQVSSGMVIPDLPQEILIDIFSRLPAKSVGKCRCLAKQWRTLLSNPQFIKFHLTRGPRKENFIFRGSYFSIASIQDEVICRNLELENHCDVVVGSCNGLVLFVDSYYDYMFLVNPITLWQLEIHLDFELEQSFQCSVYGFGYDMVNDDYKIVAIYDFTDDEITQLVSYVAVYSVKMGVWKRIGINPYKDLFNHLFSLPSCGVHVNGAIHWLAMEYGLDDTRLVIAVFNLVDEVFDKIPLPTGIDVIEFRFNDFVLLDGCLCIIGTIERRTDIWVKKEGLEDSWIKFSIDRDYCIEKPLCFIEDEEVVCLIEKLGPEPERLVVYNFKEGTMRDMVVYGGPTSYFQSVGTFVESLVSPTLSDT